MQARASLQATPATALWSPKSLVTSLAFTQPITQFITQPTNKPLLDIGGEDG